jgi:oxygen-dependent protoporphyrinogen oxidase
MPHTVIVGAGISGLTCAYHLQQAGDDVLVIESSERAGGEIHSERLNGYLIEHGPNSLRGKIPELSELLTSLGLREKVVLSSPAASSRYILRNGKPVLLPKGPLDIFSTPVISLGAKLRALREPFVSVKRSADESVASFFERRVGKEIADYLVAPYLTGVFAGNVETLSAKHTFRSVWEHEQKHGSILRGALKSRKKKPTPAPTTAPIKGIFSLPGGLCALPNALASALGDRIGYSTPVESIEKRGNSFVLKIGEADILADRLILSTPAYITSRLVRDSFPEAALALDKISYAPVAVLHLGFKTSQFAIPPVGFGMLVPPIEKKRYLGAIYSSSIFPDRAPEGNSLITVLIGGATRPELVDLSDTELLDVALTELRDAIPFTGSPEFHRIIRWQRAIPQYNVGYDAILNELDEVERKNPGLHFLGSYRGGIAIGECVRNATHLARSLV